MPPTGEARAQVMASYARAEGLNLAQAVAYADSSSDLPMLEAVGFPVAVDPEHQAGGDRPPRTRLARRALVEGGRLQEADRSRWPR